MTESGRLLARVAPLVGGGVLVLIGGALLADELGYRLPNRWLALILLLPAGLAFADGLRLARRRGWTDVLTLARLITGALFAAIGILMFLDINTGIILPLLIMALGLAALARAILKGRSR